MERYSSWLRGGTANALGREIDAWVRIPFFPPKYSKGGIIMTPSSKGNLGLGKAISYFTEHEYTVSLPLTDTQCYDLIIEKLGKLQTVQVRYTNQMKPSGNFFCKLQTKNSKRVYYSLSETFCELLFCYCSNGDKYLIPVKDIPNKAEITFYKEKSKYMSEDSFDSSLYYVS